MNSRIVFKSAGSCVANLRNSALFRAIRALDPTHLNDNLHRSELIRGSLSIQAGQKFQDQSGGRLGLLRL